MPHTRRFGERGVVDTDGCVSERPTATCFSIPVTKGVTASVKAAVLLQAEGKFKVATTSATLKNGGAAFIQDQARWVKTNSAATVRASRLSQKHRERNHQGRGGRHNSSQFH